MRIISLSLLLLSCCISNYLNAQCDLDFGSGAVPLQFTFATQSGSDIVNGASSGSFESSTQSFDIFDETTNNCTTTGGLDDITFQFEMIHAFDHYSPDSIIDAYAGSTHDVTQTSSGLRGVIPLGNSGTNETSPGDVRGYKITVTFANHVNILAQDFSVNLTSVNTAGTAHESCALIFLDETNSPYGTATYDGYYTAGGPSNDNTCTAPAIRTNSWSTSATGAYTASSTVTVTGSPDACTAISNSNGANNSGNVSPVTDAGLNPTDPIGGFVFTVYLEDIAAGAYATANTTTSTSFTSTLNGINIASVALPVELTQFNAKVAEGKVALDWTTISENNSDYFEVQWSNDGRIFTSIGEVPAAGYSSSIRNYNFSHNTPSNGQNYYRLKQVDLDDRSALSPVATAEISTTSTKLYPSLCKDFIRINSASNISEILIFDSRGALIHQQAGNPEIEINTSQWPTGNYLAQIRGAQTFEVLRFTKL